MSACRQCYHGDGARLWRAVAALVLALSGLSASAQYKVIDKIWVQAPAHAPDGQYWDTAIGGILTLRLKGILPDLQICISSLHLLRSCSRTCEDSPTCEGRFNVLVEPNALVQVFDIDPTGFQVVGEHRLPDPAVCKPCSFDTPGGPLLIRIDVIDVANYSGAFSSTAGAIPPTAPANPAPTPANPAATPRPTRAEVEASLADLRGKDNCVGNDRVFPSGTVYGLAMIGNGNVLSNQQAKRYFQLAAFATSIQDPRAQQVVLSQIRSAIGNADYDDIFVPLVLPDVQQSRRLTNAFVDATEPVARLAISKGLDKFVPTVGSSIGDKLRGDIIDDVSKGMSKSLVDDIFDFDISAECALNELAKQAIVRSVR